MKTQFSQSNSSPNFASETVALESRAKHVSMDVERQLNIEEASVLTERYRQAMKLGSRKAGFFGRNIIEKILSQEDCFGIRAYFAAEENGALTIVLVGLDASHRELISGVLGEDIIPCPPSCGAPNSLNSNVPVSLRVRSTRDHMFTGEENHLVTLAEGKRLISNFDKKNSNGVVGTEFSRRSLKSLIQAENCVGIRMYFSLDENGKPSLLVVGATSNGDDMLNGPIVEGRAIGEEREGSFRTLG